MNTKTIVSIAAACVVLIVLLLLDPIKIVSPGYRGVRVFLGKIDEVSLAPGFYFYNPITTSIYEMDVRTQNADGNTATYTKDIQTANISYSINYNLQPNAAAIIYQTVGNDWAATLINPVVSGELKSTIGRWDAVDLIGNREKATQDIEQAIATELLKKHVVLTQFQITNIDYNDEFEKAVEAKVTAVQKAAEAQNRTVQIQEEAKQTIITAKAQADAMAIKSEALSKNQNLVAYEAVQKWDGHFPTTMLGNSVPFLNLGNVGK